MEICKIILPVVTPSLNELLRMHWTKRRQLRKNYGWEFVAVGANHQKYKTEMGERRRVTIISYRAQLCDPDNLMGGLKILLDTMIDLDLICDDSPKYMELVAMQEQENNGNYRTEITIERIPGYEGKFKRKEVQ